VLTGRGQITGVLKIGRSAVSDRQVIISYLRRVPNVNTVSHASRDRGQVRRRATRAPQEGSATVNRGHS
jgi:hypothetical protein